MRRKLSANHDSDLHGLVSRRSMIAGVAAFGATASLTPQCLAAAADEASGYIDAHVHVWTPDLERYPLDAKFDKTAMQPPSFTPEQLMAHASGSNVDRIVLIQMSFYGFDNSYMLDVIRDHPGRFSGVAVIDNDDRPQETMKQLKSRGVRGFRIVAGRQNPKAWLKNPGMRSMWTCAADEGLSICPLMNPEYIPAVDAMCLEYPNTRVVVDHFARIGIDGTIRRDELERLCRLARHKNVYVKTSAFYALGKKQTPYRDLGPMIHQCIDAFGSERLMWATDCPYQVQDGHTYRDSIDLIREKLDFITENDRQWMLQKTAEKVFFS